MNGSYRRIVEIVLAATAVGLFVMLFKLFDKFWSLFNFSVATNFWQNPTFWAGFAISFGLWFLVRRSEKSMVFLDEVALELSRVIWPERGDTVKSSGVILVLIAIAALVIFVFDGLWGTLMEKFLQANWL
ncbi:MAG: preprotein translocase subunit SecE [Deltaproteobacteria bacterium]|nr:preprotein translocase subunit SecE [Deltaproteobacteria bacterium]